MEALFLRKRGSNMYIMVVVNKDFEYAGFTLGVESRLHSGELGQLKMVSKNPTGGPNKFIPSAIYRRGKDTIREFCIAYLFGENENTSNSEQKHVLLKRLIAAEKPDLIISVSTCETTENAQFLPPDGSLNGCVLVGTTFFAKDCREYDPGTSSFLDVSNPWFAESGFPCPEISSMVNKNQKIIAVGMDEVPNAPAGKTTVYAENGARYTSLGVINVMNYDKYVDADAATFEEFAKQTSDGAAVCLETTHAVVKMAAEAIKGKGFPVLFISPVVDRYKSFDSDVDGKWGVQNAVASYNAGVVVANMLDLYTE